MGLTLSSWRTSLSEVILRVDFNPGRRKGQANRGCLSCSGVELRKSHVKGRGKFSLRNNNCCSFLKTDIYIRGIWSLLSNVTFDLNRKNNSELLAVNRIQLTLLIYICCNAKYCRCFFFFSWKETIISASPEEIQTLILNYLSLSEWLSISWES